MEDLERKSAGLALNTLPLDTRSAHLMLEQIGVGRNWITGPLDAPLGRGINFQINVPSITPLVSALAQQVSTSSCSPRRSGTASAAKRPEWNSSSLPTPTATSSAFNRLAAADLCLVRPSNVHALSMALRYRSARRSHGLRDLVAAMISADCG